MSHNAKSYFGAILNTFAERVFEIPVLIGYTDLCLELARIVALQQSNCLINGTWRLLAIFRLTV